MMHYSVEININVGHEERWWRKAVKGLLRAFDPVLKPRGLQNLGSVRLCRLGSGSAGCLRTVLNNLRK